MGSGSQAIGTHSCPQRPNPIVGFAIATFHADAARDVGTPARRMRLEVRA